MPSPDTCIQKICAAKGISGLNLANLYHYQAFFLKWKKGTAMENDSFIVANSQNKGLGLVAFPPLKGLIP